MNPWILSIEGSKLQSVLPVTPKLHESLDHVNKEVEAANRASCHIGNGRILGSFQQKDRGCKSCFLSYRKCPWVLSIKRSRLQGVLPAISEMQESFDPFNQKVEAANRASCHIEYTRIFGSF